MFDPHARMSLIDQLPLGPAIAPPPVAVPRRRQRSLPRRCFDHATTAFNRALHRLPPCRWLYRRALAALELTHVEVPMATLHPDLDGLRIAFLVDIHAGSYVTPDDLCRVFERVAATAPDVVCLGGDLINSRGDEIHELRRALALLAPPHGVFAVPGNHEHYWARELDTWTAVLEESGVQLLLNRGVRIGRGRGRLWLGGVDDLTDGAPDLAASLRGRGQGEPTVLMAHQPDHFAEVATHGVELTLSGHTHGGQIRLFGWTPLVHSRLGYRAGMFAHGDSRLYVSRGVGATVLPLRIGARAEVPIFELRNGGAVLSRLHSPFCSGTDHA
jgi:hypothetical protein